MGGIVVKAICIVGFGFLICIVLGTKGFFVFLNCFCHLILEIYDHLWFYLSFYSGYELLLEFHRGTKRQDLNFQLNKTNSVSTDNSACFSFPFCVWNICRSKLQRVKYFCVYSSTLVKLLFTNICENNDLLSQRHSNSSLIYQDLSKLNIVKNVWLVLIPGNLPC